MSVRISKKNNKKEKRTCQKEGKKTRITRTVSEEKKKKKRKKDVRVRVRCIELFCFSLSLLITYPNENASRANANVLKARKKYAPFIHPKNRYIF